MTALFKEKQVCVDGGKKIAYFDEGQGIPVLLFHGWLSCKELWCPLMAELIKTGRYRVVAPDLPGFGSSSPVDSRKIIPESLRTLERFTQKIGLKNFFLFGNSLGGVMGILFTERNPKLVSRVIVRGMPLSYRQLPKRFVSRLSYALIKFSTRRALTREVYRRIITGFYRKHLTLGLNSKDLWGAWENIDICVRNVKKLDTLTARELVLFLLRLDLRRQVKKISEKTVLIVNDDDELVNHTAFDYQAINNVRIFHCRERHSVYDLGLKPEVLFDALPVCDSGKN